MEIRKATRQKAKLRLALASLGGGGKTYTGLLVATILSLLLRPRLGRRGRICGIDTEHESMELYSMTDREREEFAAMSDQDALRFITRKDANAFDFDVIQLSDHSPRKYVDAINLVAKSGYDICIVDSLSHAWAGKNGALEQKDNIAARGGNSYTAWRDVTPMHNLLVDTMLSCPMHFIGTLRKKMEYVQEKDPNTGKTVIRQVGLADIQREGMEYEFTIFADMEKETNSMRISKHRLPGVLNIGDVFEKPGEMFTRKIWDWLQSGADPAPIQRPAPQPEPTTDTIDQSATNALTSLGKAETLAELDALIPALKMLSGDALATGRRIYGERKAHIMKKIAEAATAPDPTSGASSQDTTMPPASSETSSDASIMHGPAVEQIDAIVAQHEPTAPEAA